MKRFFAFFIAAASFLMVSTLVVAAPCTGVDRQLNPALQLQIATPVEAHLRSQLDEQIASSAQVAPADVLAVFRVGSWHIVHVNNHVTDEPYLFYSKSPSLSSRYITAWAGGATVDEKLQIQTWAIKSMPAIPKNLAACFAWYVTTGLAQ